MRNKNVCFIVRVERERENKLEIMGLLWPLTIMVAQPDMTQLFLTDRAQCVREFTRFCDPFCPFVSEIRQSRWKSSDSERESVSGHLLMCVCVRDQAASGAHAASNVLLLELQADGVLPRHEREVHMCLSEYISSNVCERKKTGKIYLRLDRSCKRKLHICVVGESKERFWGISAASCCSFFSFLGSCLIGAAFGRSHDVSWCFLCCAMADEMYKNVGDSSGD